MANQDFRVKNGLQVGLGANVVGIVTAESFSGSAVGLTSVPSASLTGTISSERLSGTYDIDILGTVSGDTINATTATVTEQLNVGAGDTGVFATATDGTLSVSGVSTFKDTTDNTLGDATTGAVQIRGGLGISSNVTVGGGLSVTGDSYFVGMVTFASGTDGNISIGDSAGDNVIINAQIDSDLIPDDDGTYDLGSSTKEWQDLYIDGTANIDSLAADTAAIGDLTDNQVVVAGTSGELEGDANLIYDGTELIVGTATTGSVVRTDGTLNVSGISTFQDRVIFDSTNSIQVPVGTDEEKDEVGVAVTGQIRYNTTNSQFEGFGPGNDWGSLGGVKDVDGDTYVKPESSPGSDEDALTFFTGGTERAVIDSDGKVGIGTTNPTSTLDLDGTQNVSGISTFQDRVIFDSTNSIQIPVGTSAERDAIGAAVTGQIRYNTTLSSFEGYGPGGEWGTLGGVKDIDQDTYITAQKDLSVDDDALRFYTNGTEQVSIDSTGKVGIGSTQPTSTLDLDGTLNVTGISTFHDDVNIGIGGTVAFFDISAGKVGVGTLPSATSGKISLPTEKTPGGNDALISAGNQLINYGLYVADDSDNANVNHRQEYVRQYTARHYTVSVGADKAFRVSNSNSFNISATNAPGGMTDDQVAFVVSPDTSTELRYNYSKKLETTTDGFKVLNGTSETAVISGPQNIILDPSPDDVVAIVEGDISAAGVSTITGITTTNIAVGNLIQEVDGVISAGTTVTSVGISSLTISNVSLGAATNQEFTFANQTPTGIVRIKGDLYVDGTRTEINSTTLTVDDLNVVVASGATNGLTADTAGLTVDGANAYLKYNYNAGTNETWELNKNVGIGTDNATAKLDVDGTLNVSGVSTFRGNVSIAGTERKLVFDAETNPFSLHDRPKIQIDTPTSNRYYEFYALDYTSVQYVRHLASDLDYNISVSNDRTFLVSGGSNFSKVLGTPGVNDSDIAFKIIPESSTELRFNKEKRLETTGYGVSVTGGLNVTGISTFEGDVNIGTAATVAFFDISSGNIGLGTNAPLQKFQIGAANTLGISTDGKVFTVTSDGSVGVGTTNPTSKLDVDGTLNVSGVSTFSDDLIVGTATTGVVARTDGTLSVSGIATVGTATTGVVARNDGTLSVSGISTFSDDLIVGTATTGVVARTDGTLNVSGISTFQDDVNIGIGGTVAFFDISSGNVGIGSTAPTSTLDVDGTLNVSGVSTFQDNVNIGVGLSITTFENATDSRTFVSLTSRSQDKVSLGFNTTTNYTQVGSGKLAELQFDPESGFLTYTMEPHIGIIDSYDTDKYFYEFQSRVGAAETTNRYVRNEVKKGSYVVALDDEYEFAVVERTGLYDDTVSGTNDYAFKVVPDAQTELYYNQNKKLETTGYGVSVTDGLNVSGVSTFSEDVKVKNLYPLTDNSGVVGSSSLTWSNGRFTNLTIDSTLSVRSAIDLADSDVLRFGSSDDVKVYYSGVANDLEIELESAATQIAITNSGTYKHIITKDGKVGINTSTTPTRELEVYGDAYISGISTFQDDVNIGSGGTTAFFDISSGRVGIGSTNPTKLLDIDGTLGVSGISVFTNAVSITPSNSSTIPLNFESTSGFIPQISFKRTSTARYGIHYFIPAGQDARAIHQLDSGSNFEIGLSGGSFIVGDNTFGGFPVTTKAFEVKEDAETYLTHNHNKKLETTGYGVSVTDGLNVSGISTFQDDVNIGIGGTVAFFDISSGNVGINSTTPTATLDVVGDIALNNGVNSGKFVIQHSYAANTGSRLDFIFVP